MQSRSFTKLFASITDSSIWSEDDATRIIWITMLAMADSHGYVGASVPGLAARSRKSIAEVEIALAKFRAPDPYSRTREFDGRRIADVDGGWVLLTYEKHRAVLDAETEKAKKRRWAAKARAEAKSATSEASESRPDKSTVDQVDQSRLSPSVSLSGSGSGSGSDPDPDPERARDRHERTEGVTVVDPHRGRFVPDDFEPTEAHRVRCRELRLSVDELCREFKTFEFNRDYSDWPKRFSRWIEDAKLKAEAERGKALSGAGKGPRTSFGRAPNNPLGWEPNAAHAAFAADHMLDLQRYARSYILSGALETRSIADAHQDFGKRLVRVTKGQPFGFDLVAA